MSLFRLAATRTARKFIPHHNRISGIPARPSDATMAAGTLSGAVSGAAVGSIAGVPGALVGAVIGGAMGAAAGRAIGLHASEESATSQRLDAEIGVIGGDLGAADPNQPPARIGAFSMGSLGMGRTSHPPAEGPMSSPGETDSED
jgi:hypothetical protein